MSLLSFFSRRGSAPVARERLQLIIAHERADDGRSDLVVILREEILAVIAKHVAIEPRQGADQGGARRGRLDPRPRHRAAPARRRAADGCSDRDGGQGEAGCRGLIPAAVLKAAAGAG